MTTTFNKFYIVLSFMLLCFCLAAQPKARGNENVPTKNEAPQKIGKTYALIVGISRYENSLIQKLDYADRDALAFRDFLIASGVDSNNIVKLINEEAKSGDILTDLDGLLDRTTDGDKLYIYFSGHGDREGKLINQPGYLLPYNSPAKVYANGAIKIDDVKEYVATFSSKGVQVIVIADACHAGNLTGGMAGMSAVANILGDKWQNEIKILSCQPGELSLEGPQWGGGRGLFSYYLIRGLAGEASSDTSGQVTLNNLDLYLRAKVPDEAKPMSQYPVVSGDMGKVISTTNKSFLLAHGPGEAVAYGPINPKGFDTELLKGLDDSVRYNYFHFKEYMDSGIYISPNRVFDNISAYYYLKNIKDNDSTATLVSLMKRNLSAQLLNKANQLLDSFVSSNMDRHKFDLTELGAIADILRKMLGDEKLKRLGFLSKALFIEAAPLNLSNQLELKIAESKIDSALRLDSSASYILLWKSQCIRADKSLIPKEREAKISQYLANVRQLSPSYDNTALASEQVNSVAFSEDTDGLFMCLSYESNKSCLWNTRTGTIKQYLFGHTAKINSTRFSSNGCYVLTASDDNTARIWPIKLPEDTVVVLRGHSGPVTLANFSPDNERVVTISIDKTIKIWNAKSGKMLLNFGPLPEEAISAQYSPNGKTIATTFWDHTTKIWDSQTGDLLRTYFGQGKEITLAAYSSDGKILATAAADNTIAIWGVETGKLLRTIITHDWINSLAFSPDNENILVASKDIEIWNLKGETRVLNRSDSTGWFNSAVYSRNAKWILTSSSENKCSILKASDGQLMASFITIGNGFITILPSGYYQGPPKSVKQYFSDLAARDIDFDQFDLKYNRPDKVIQVLGNMLGSPDTDLINIYYQAWQKRIIKSGIDTASFEPGFSIPFCDIINRDEFQYLQYNSSFKFRVKAIDSIYHLDRFNIWVNGVPISSLHGISIRPLSINTCDTDVTVTLSEGENAIEVSTTNVNGIESYRKTLHLRYMPQAAHIGKVFFVGIGIDHGKDPQFDLRYSAKDIKDLLMGLKAKFGESLIIDTLFNKNVTIANVKNLKKKLLTSDVNDRVIVAYAGHGLLSESLDYYLGTYDIDFRKPEKNGLPYDDLEWLLDSIPSRKKLLLIDACHSGEVDKDEFRNYNNDLLIDSNSHSRGPFFGFPKGIPAAQKKGSTNSFELMKELFANVHRGSGTIVVAAAAGSGYAIEDSHLKNGVFTYSILELLRAQKQITINDFKEAIIKRVQELTNGLQNPSCNSQIDDYNWILW